MKLKQEKQEDAIMKEPSVKQDVNHFSALHNSLLETYLRGRGIIMRHVTPYIASLKNDVLVINSFRLFIKLYCRHLRELVTC